MLIKRYITYSKRLLSAFNENKMSLETAKQIAAYKAIDDYITKNDMVIGIGSGSTIIYSISRLAQKIKSENLKNIICVPTSFQAKHCILENNLTLGELERNPVLDVAIDGADECDIELNCIKGGGGCLLQEKIVASCAKNLVIVADYTKNSEYLTEKYKKIPIEVSPIAYVPIKNRIESLFGGEACLRMGKSKAGPCITDNSNFILDWFFEGSSNTDFDGINREIMMIPGVIDTGLFINMAKKAYFGMTDGTVLEKEI